METVNNLASAASRAIWGDSTQQTTENETAGTEPVSGVKGNVEAGEPYDKGNDLTSTTDTTSAADPTSTSAPDTASAADTTTTSKTNPSSTGHPTELPTYLNYQNPNTDKSVDNTTTATPATKDTSNTTSKLTDNTPPTSFDKPATSTDNTSAAPSGTADPATGSQATTTDQGAQEPISEPTSTETNTSKTEDTTDKDDEADDSAAKGESNEDTPSELKESGIQETKKDGDHAPRFDTFKSPGGPHIDHPKDDGRVGPDVAKGDLKEFEEKDDKKTADVPADVESKDHADKLSKDSGSRSGSGDAGESTGKEKVSLKDKIKAKLHKN